MMNVKQKQDWLTCVLPLLHGLLFAGLYLLGYQFHLFDVLPNNETIARWDTGWYKDILQYGYKFYEGRQCNVAFFPAFPFFWKFTGLSALGISLVNYLIFSVGAVILMRGFQIKNSIALLLISSPAAFFFFVPYTESMFFLFASMLLVGLKKDYLALTVIGFLGASLTRSVALFMLPAIMMIWFFQTTSIVQIAHNAGKYLAYLASVVSAVLLVALLQFIQTGQWFPFVGVQKYWEKKIALPKFPLWSWAGGYIYWMDMIAFIIGLIGILLVLYLLYKKLKALDQLKVSPPIILSLAYLAFIGLFTLFATSSLHSTARYIFAAPFFWVLFNYFCKLDIKTRHWVFMLGAALLFIILSIPKQFSYLNQTQWFLYLLLICNTLILLSIQTFPRIHRYTYIPLYLLSTVGQLIIFYGWLSGSIIV